MLAAALAWNTAVSAFENAVAAASPPHNAASMSSTIVSAGWRSLRSCHPGLSRSSSRRLSGALGLQIRLTCKDPSVQTLTVELGSLTLPSALKAIVEQGIWESAWQLSIMPGPSEPGGRTIGIMVAPKGRKKR